MRTAPLALTFFSVLATLMIAVSTVRADAVKVTPELTVLSTERTASEDGGPTVLRGSAIRRGVIGGGFDGAFQPSRFQFGAGDKLWLTDPVSGEVIVCDERRTSRVGSRFISCLEDRLPFRAAK